MNVFVLCTGRCGSMTFARACSHITNYTSAHESRHEKAESRKLLYPDNHIEVDNRLSWRLGRLDQRYGRSAFYVHLTRNPQEVAESFIARWDDGIIRAYRTVIWAAEDEPRMEVAADFIQNVTANIELFLRDKTRQMAIQIEQAREQFPEFWRAIGAEGDLNLALQEFSIKHNARQT